MHTYDKIMDEAQAKLREHDFVQAMQLFAEAHKVAPERKEPLIELALLFIAHEDTKGAVGFLEKALQIDGLDVFIRLNLALSYYDLEQAEEAVEHLREAILLIQYIVASTRIDEMFGHASDADVQRAAELEKTGEQAIDLLKDIAGLREGVKPVAEIGTRIFRLAS